MNSILDKLLAILRRDLLTAIRHRSGFAMTFAGLIYWSWRLFIILLAPSARAFILAASSIFRSCWSAPASTLFF